MTQCPPILPELYVHVPPGRVEALLDRLRHIDRQLVKAQERRNHKESAAAVRVARWELGQLITQLREGRA